MRKINIDYVMTGMQLAKAVFTPEGKVLLTSGMELNDNYIERLKRSGILYIHIEDGITGNIILNDIVCEETRQEAKALINNMMNNQNFYEAINVDKVKELVDKILIDLLSDEEIIAHLSDIKTVDDYTFEHSINVCIMSLITGIGLGYNLSRLKDLGIGAILHDIGKLKIPEDILKKPFQLTVEEFDEIKKHTIYGYERLKIKNNISMISAFIAFGHHERFDGSGYPLQLRGENIHQCARIVAVSDVYDALTSNRVYRKKLRPHEAIEYITSLKTHHFEKEIVDSFVKYVAIYPVGTNVILNTKEKGLVIHTYKNMPTRPIVRVIYDECGKKLMDHHEVDLTKRMNVFVEEACDF